MDECAAFFSIWEECSVIILVNMGVFGYLHTPRPERLVGWLEVGACPMRCKIP
jgi:hypothetical protein